MLNEVTAQFQALSLDPQFMAGVGLTLPNNMAGSLSAPLFLSPMPVLNNYCSCEGHTSDVTEENWYLEKSITNNEMASIRKLSLKHPATKKLRKQDMVKYLRGLSKPTSQAFKERNFIKTPKSKKGPKITKDFRGSKYRGVSVNGRSWQVFIVIDKIKRYGGSVNNEIGAALLYDKLAIIFHGTNVSPSILTL